MQIRERQSWEAILEDIVRSVDARGENWGLSRCHYIVVQSLTDGAVILDTRKRTAEIVFDPRHTEDEWLKERDGAGSMVGYSTYFCAAIAARIIKHLTARPGVPAAQDNSTHGIAAEIRLGVIDGLAASRLLMLGGFRVENELTLDGKHYFPAMPLSFPDDLLASMFDLPTLQRWPNANVSHTETLPTVVQRLLATERTKFCQQTIKLDRLVPAGSAPEFICGTDATPPAAIWTLFDERCDTHTKVLDLASQIIRVGPDRIRWEIPIGKFGRLWCTDREEVEHLRAVRSVISEYLQSRERRIPLSIAVFGPPGSGKSFMITQLFESLPSAVLIPDNQVRHLTFNLSQFRDSASLFECLHQIRDVSLSGNVPLIFWDEFDATIDGRQLAWLRYFLAPMQDGQFQHENVTHNVGRAVFVFAGGTNHTFDQFKHACGKKMGVLAKGEDFISRLKAAVDVLPIDPVRGQTEVANSMIVRRALVLRSALKRFASKMASAEQITVSKPVREAFLLAERYCYGARSIEALVQMSSLFEHSTFQVSSLPPKRLLKMHVDTKSFLNILAAVGADEESAR
jgi:hypothetical protein